MGGVPVVMRLRAADWWGTPRFVVEAPSPLPCTGDPDQFHVDGMLPDQARELCEGCGYVEACRRYALADPKLSGVWGGTTGRERERLRRAAKAAA